MFLALKKTEESQMNQPIELPMSDLSQWLLDSPEQGQFKVGKRLFSDPAVFEREMERIFEGNWIYLCHESQIPSPHDFYTTRMGRQPVVITRGGDGAIHGFLNACAHRGATLCRTVKGNSQFLTCSYHGWVYDSTGRNVNIKEHVSGGYPAAFLNQSHDLKPIARLQAYKGFIFGSLSSDVVPLDEHLADAKPFIDLVAAQPPGGAEVIPGGSMYTHRGNWKMQPENGIDGYHATATHANYFAILKRSVEREMAAAARAGKELKRPMTGDLSQMESGWYDLHNGHNLMWLQFSLPEHRSHWHYRDQLREQLGEGAAEWLLHRQRNLLIFPNLLLMDHVSTQIRVIRPVSYNRTQVKIYCVGGAGETRDERNLRIRQYEDFYNASGLATPDDLANFEACDDGVQALGMPWLDGYERGMAQMTEQPDCQARQLGINPAAGGSDLADETLMHGIYRRWLKLMSD